MQKSAAILLGKFRLCHEIVIEFLRHPWVQILTFKTSGDLLTSKFEIIVTLIGVTEETGNTIQVPASHSNVPQNWEVQNCPLKTI